MVKKKKRSFIQNRSIEDFNIKNDDYNDGEEHKLKKMYEAINKLNAIDKALVFYYLEDFTGKQIAEQLGISEVNARVKLNRAKQKLKELINH